MNDLVLVIVIVAAIAVTFVVGVILDSHVRDVDELEDDTDDELPLSHVRIIGTLRDTEDNNARTHTRRVDRRSA